jgi:uncharacterized protein YkwD
MMSLPSQSVWDTLSDGEKALWLINRERIDRGLAPFHGIEANVTGVAQAYAQYLMDNDLFSHNADGKTPWQRLMENPVINACHDSFFAENLAGSEFLDSADDDDTQKHQAHPKDCNLQSQNYIIRHR